MAHSTSKPLPDLPEHSMFQRITIEGNTLISTLVQRVVDEEGLDTGWTDVILGAVVAFGEYLKSSQLLIGLKTARKAQNVARVAQDASLREQRRKEREKWKDSKSSKGKGSERPNDIEMTDTDHSITYMSDDSKLKEIQFQIAASNVPFAISHPTHLLLTASNLVDSGADSEGDYDIVSTSKDCTFRRETYVLPFFNDGQLEEQRGSGGVVLYGLDSWQKEVSDLRPRIVGGTFVFRSISSPAAFESLLSVLRLALYTYLSIIIEQSMLTNLLIPLEYPKPPIPPVTPSSSIPPSLILPEAEDLSPGSPRKARAFKTPAGLWSYLSRKTEGILHRVTASLPETGRPISRASSLDLSSVRSTRTDSERPRLSEDTLRLNVPNDTDVETVAQETIKVSRAQQVEEEERRDRERYGPFGSTVRRLQDKRCILTTSPNVSFPVPSLIDRLARREEEQKLGGHTLTTSESSLESSASSYAITLTTATTAGSSSPPALKLNGIEKTALGSVLGWENRDARGKGMASIRGFIRLQGLTVLYEEHVETSDGRRVCSRPKLVSYRFWARSSSVDAERDQTLGEVVERFCEPVLAEKTCEIETCCEPRDKHAVSWTCGGVQVEATVNQAGNGTADNDDIMIWQSCAVCLKETEVKKMEEGAYLYSFAKFLELLLWSSVMLSLSLCDHITSSSPSTTSGYPISDSRFNVLRHFAYKGRILTFTLKSIIMNIYEIQFPRLQIISSSVLKEEKPVIEGRKRKEGEEEKHALGIEIEEWWSGLQGRVDKLDIILQQEAEQAANSKNLPPLPLSDDEESEEEEEETRSSTPARNLSPSRRPHISRSTSSQITIGTWNSQSLWTNFRGQRLGAPYPPGNAIPFRESRQLLGRLRQSFERSEQTLKRSLYETPVSSLNDVRRTFRATARGALKRLSAWQKKHAPGAPADLYEGDTIHTEPEWWNGNCHAVPGGRVVVREGESGSIIAFTLSSIHYQRELANLNALPGLSSSPSQSSSPLVSEHNTPTHESTIKYSRSRPPLPDPDTSDSAVWEETEVFSTAITRREHPREGSTLLGLRDVLRTKRSFDTSVLGSRFSGSVSRGAAALAPPSAWAPAQVQVNLQPADGQVSQFPEAAEVVEKTLEAQYPAHSRAATPSSSYSTDDGPPTPTPSGFVERHIRRGGDTTIIELRGSPAASLENEDNPFEQQSMPLIEPKPVAVTSTVPPTISTSGRTTPTPQSGNFSGALSSAMRYLINAASPNSLSRAPSPVPVSTHHGLLAYEPAATIDEHPHIKYDWTIGQRLRFSCTVYYAKQFDALRKRCGVEHDVVKSLERSENWTAVGGKSKSNFWKSSDDRFIIKTLVNAWNVADLQVLIDLAPSYFRYLDSTAYKASALAKLMGFYTVEVKNIETGAVQARHDLLVMENLFYKHKISRTFDLKGIQSRRVKASQESSEKTLFDGEWIDAQQRAPLLIQPDSGYTLLEALKADGDFLAKSNIMDYSLLLGIDEEKHEISCGLVDIIGSYTFAKTLEYKAKHNLNSGKGKEVTVIPPTEYHNRFISSMENYFLICPDKWTKPPQFVDRTAALDLHSVV
ncbi:hypothetical protein M422DRAFT_24592 [Sphaerobolus stellatus SS14]|nr:hypothetical protein M422DRAFT_24592 [Sphaerobolus stellatus SS14]